MKKDNNQGFWIPIGVAVGTSIGVAIGVTTDNLGLWLGVGISIGSAFGIFLMIKKNHSYLLPFPTMTDYHDYRSLIEIVAEAHQGVCYLYGDEIHYRPQMLLL